MLHVTERAKHALQTALVANRGDDLDIGIRLLLSEQGEFGLALDHSELDDLVVEHDGLAVLLIDPEVAEIAGDATIDFQEGGGAALVIEPQAA